MHSFACLPLFARSAGDSNGISAAASMFSSVSALNCNLQTLRGGFHWQTFQNHSTLNSRLPRRWVAITITLTVSATAVAVKWTHQDSSKTWRDVYGHNWLFTHGLELWAGLRQSELNFLRSELNSTHVCMIHDGSQIMTQLDGRSMKHEARSAFNCVDSLPRTWSTAITKYHSLFCDWYTTNRWLWSIEFNSQTSISECSRTVLVSMHQKWQSKRHDRHDCSSSRNFWLRALSKLWERTSTRTRISNRECRLLIYILWLVIILCRSFHHISMSWIYPMGRQLERLYWSSKLKS